ncbi:ribonuclease P protein component [Leptobacterium flavescens]|uniref:Ribonuclease P protein component n=1 Tax=Leptobacterium flavescens TaxID=472055 RepID=A0A6P0ULK9_9FLAO|nr:ribonuclease P protein component [Leptobacterium flavescens]NER14231.1 ribonuclease P protein component [Leptobacterium flavescens]
MDQRFPREEKLKSNLLIEQLFSEGSSVSKYPLKLIYVKTEPEDDVKVKAGFSVPKRKFKKAVQRNQIKRLIREAYRLNKSNLFNNLSTSYAFMFLYLGKEEPDFSELNTTMERLLTRFLKQTQTDENI